MRAQDLGQKLAAQARGVAFNDSRPRLAKVTNVTNWDTAGIRCVFEDTAEVIACEARGAGMIFDIAVDDYVWVERVEGGKQNKWRVSGFGDRGGVFVPTVRAASLPTISSLDASDGSPADVVSVDADGVTTVGDGTNEVQISYAGWLTLSGTAKVMHSITLPLEVGGGTATTAPYLGGPSVVFDTDGETAFLSCLVPFDWDQASDMSIVAAVLSEIDEDAADRVSIDAQIASYIGGDTAADAGQSAAMASATQHYQNNIELTTGTIDYDDGSYPIQYAAPGDGSMLRIKLTCNLGGANEPTGPLHVCAWWIEYVADRLGGVT